MYVYTHTHTRGVQGGPSAPPPATTPPVGKVGGYGRGAEGPPCTFRARACVCVYTYICDMF